MDRGPSNQVPTPAFEAGTLAEDGRSASKAALPDQSGVSSSGQTGLGKSKRALLLQAMAEMKEMRLTLLEQKRLHQKTLRDELDLAQVSFPAMPLPHEVVWLDGCTVQGLYAFFLGRVLLTLDYFSM